MAAASLTLILAISILSLTSIFSLIESTNGGRGFSIDLTHRDSSKSPFYDPSQSPSQRIHNALKRSINRVHRYTTSKSSPDAAPQTALTDIISANGEYLINISIGTPPFQVLAIADTGSDLIWTQCKPCTQCYKQKSPLFDPKRSSSYRGLSCSSTSCESAGGTCGFQSESCEYSVAYGDRSYTNGVVAVDTLTLGSTTGRPVLLPKTTFGCGHDNAGTFNGEGSGIVGLGGGSASLITQMDSIIYGKFSYCLVPLSSAQSDKSSKMNFGSKGVVSGEGVVSTPLVTNKSPKTFYYLTLEAISVGDERLEFEDQESSPSGSFVGNEGNIIIDSGTTLTLLPEGFYGRLESAVEKRMDGERRVEDPSQSLSLCYQSEGDLETPPMVAHFKGADLELKTYNTFVRVSEDVVCFAFASISHFAIFGNLAQMNWLVGYDLVKKTVSFKPTDCTKF